MAHMSGSMGHYDGYGTIQIHLLETDGISQGLEYQYSIQGSTNKHTATADRIDGKVVLIDSNFTIGENPPPFTSGKPLTIFVPHSSMAAGPGSDIPLLTTIITDIKPFEEEQSGPTTITTKLYDGSNLRTFHLSENMPIEEFVSTILKDVPVIGINELDSNNQTVSSYNPTQPQSKKTKKKSPHKKKKKKNKFNLFKGGGKKITIKTRSQSPAQTRSQSPAQTRSQDTRNTGGNSGRSY